MTETLNNSELNALISLLDEPSILVFDKIRGKILHYGVEAIPYLEKAWDNSFDNEVQKRVEEIIHNIQLTDIRNELKNWKENDRTNLLRGFFLVTKYQYPDLNYQTIEEKIEKIRRDIWLELNSNLTALEKIKVLNHILFDVHQFSGNKTNVDAVQNLYLNNILETKKANHLTLGILFIIMAQKLGLPVFGVNLPQHFILAYLDEFNEEKISAPNENEVLFYINPLNKGAVFTQREIELFIKHIKLKSQPDFYRPCDNLSIIRRLVENMMEYYAKIRQTEKLEELKSIMDIL